MVKQETEVDIDLTAEEMYDDFKLDEDDMPMKAEELGGKLKRSHSESSIIELLPKKQRLQSSDSEKEKGPLQVKDLFKPKGKKAIAKMVLNDDVVERRFESQGGLRQFPIDLPLAQLDMLVSRKFLAAVYGGNTQETFPSIGQEKYAQHGMDDFMYLHIDYHPWAPQIPGRPGLWFSTGNSERQPFEARVLTRDLKLAMWQYIGQYDVRPAAPLTREEWINQSDKVKRTWTTQLCKKKWGNQIRVRVQAHKEIHPRRTVTPQKIEEVFQSGRWENITPDDIMAALNSGQERLAVWTLNCIGYDCNFQKELCEKFPQWTPPTKKQKHSKRHTKKKSNVPAKRTSKQVESEISEAEYNSDDYTPS